jgi:hypothetical protein
MNVTPSALSRAIVSETLSLQSLWRKTAAKSGQPELVVFTDGAGAPRAKPRENGYHAG